MKGAISSSYGRNVQGHWMALKRRIGRRERLFSVIMSFGTIAATIFFYQLGLRTTLIVLLLGTLLSAWYGGFGPGMFTAVFSVSFTYLLDLLPRSDAGLEIPLFLIFAIIVSALEQSRIETSGALSNAKQQLEAILDGVGDAITAQGPDGQPVFANTGAARFTGASSSDEVVRTPVSQYRSGFAYFAEDGTAITYDRLPNRRALNEGVASEMVFRRVQQGTGEEQWTFLRSTPIFDERGTVQMAINIFRDVTASKRSADELERLNRLLREQTARITNLVRNIPGIVWETELRPGVEPKVVFINDYVEQMVGFAPDTLLTQNREPGRSNWMMNVHPEDREAVEQNLRVAIRGGGNSFTFRLRRADGQYMDAETFCTATLDANGAQHIYGVTMDITRRKQAELALLRQTEELRRSNQDLQQFAYVASHDLQEPLRMVTSYLQLVEQRYANKLDVDGREFIAFAVDGSNRMKALIQDLLAYSRVETSHRDMQPIRIEDALGDALRNLQLTIAESGAQVRWAPGCLPMIPADRGQIGQLFQNLIGNAIKFRSEKPPEIRIDCVRDKDHWHFTVTDNGIGIDPQYLDRIFVVFQRLHSRKQYPGTGIGLAICKRVVEAHRGRIWATSAQGQGATIHFTLPALPGSAVQPALLPAAQTTASEPAGGL